MIKRFVQLLFIILSFNVVYGQSDTLHIRLGHTTLPYSPLVLLDGLEISQKKLVEFNLDEHCIKKVKLINDYCSSDTNLKYCGAVSIQSKLLIVLNDRLLYSRQEKTETLSKIKQSDVLEYKMLSKQEALEKYGKRGKFGALVIKTNKDFYKNLEFNSLYKIELYDFNEKGGTTTAGAFSNFKDLINQQVPTITLDSTDTEMIKQILKSSRKTILRQSKTGIYLLYLKFYFLSEKLPHYVMLSYDSSFTDFSDKSIYFISEESHRAWLREFQERFRKEKLEW